MNEKIKPHFGQRYFHGYEATPETKEIFDAVAEVFPETVPKGTFELLVKVKPIIQARTNYWWIRQVAIMMGMPFDVVRDKAAADLGQLFAELRDFIQKSERERIANIIKEYKLESASARDDSLEMRATGWKLLWQALKGKAVKKK